jgi:hypothetical protein
VVQGGLREDRIRAIVAPGEQERLTEEASAVARLLDLIDSNEDRPASYGTQHVAPQSNSVALSSSPRARRALVGCGLWAGTECRARSEILLRFGLLPTRDRSSGVAGYEALERVSGGL